MDFRTAGPFLVGEIATHQCRDRSFPRREGCRIAPSAHSTGSAGRTCAQSRRRRPRSQVRAGSPRGDAGRPCEAASTAPTRRGSTTTRSEAPRPAHLRFAGAARCGRRWRRDASRPEPAARRRCASATARSPRARPQRCWCSPRYRWETPTEARAPRHQTCSSGGATWRRNPSRSASRASHASRCGVAGPACANTCHRRAAAPAGMSPIEKRSPAT